MATNLDFEYGFSADGIESLLTEVKGHVINDAAGHATSGIADIKATCEQIWQGQSREDFCALLKSDAEKFAASLEALYLAFEKEMVNAGMNFAEFDKNLFK